MTHMLVYNAKIKNVEDKIRAITNLATNTAFNSKTNEGKINEVTDKISSITNLSTTTVLTDVKNIIPDVSNLVKNNEYNKKLMKLKIKLLLIIIMINTLFLWNS